MKRGDKVASGAYLYRRGYNSPERKYLNPDGSATSRVFKLREKDKGKLSVDIQSLTTPEKAVLDPTQYNLFILKNQVVESIGLETIYDADYQAKDRSHCLIIGMEFNDETKPAYLVKQSRKIFP